MEKKPRASILLTKQPRQSARDLFDKKTTEGDPTTSQRSFMERTFTQFNDGKKAVEMYRFRQLLKRILDW